MLRRIINRLSGDRRKNLKRKLFRYRYLYHKRLIGRYSREDFEIFLRESLKIRPGDHIMIHSSYEPLAYWGLQALEILSILKDVITPEGVILIPTFVTHNSREYVRECQSYNTERTPSTMGILSELFRRQRDTVRSMDPLKPVAAWGKNREDYIKEHHLSLYSYDEKSPFYKLAVNGGKVIGLGASIHYLTLVHTVEDIMGDSFPIRLYDRKIFDFTVTDPGGETLTVRKKIQENPFAHRMKIKKFCRNNISNRTFRTFSHNLTPYFFCGAKGFVEEGIKAAESGITIYGKY